MEVVKRKRKDEEESGIGKDGGIDLKDKKQKKKPSWLMLSVRIWAVQG